MQLGHCALVQNATLYEVVPKDRSSKRFKIGTMSQVMTTVNTHDHAGYPRGFWSTKKPHSLTDVLYRTVPADGHALKVVIVNLLSGEEA